MRQGKKVHPIAPFLTLVVILAAFRPTWAQATEPILRLEVGTHNAGIFSMAMDPSNRILVTGSEDKTVRVWEISGSAQLVRILRPPVGEGEEGQIFAVALSPDAKTVACGARIGSPKQNDACLYLFDRATGAVIRRLGGLPGWVQHLAYTSDGRFLVAVTSVGGGIARAAGMRVYRLPDYSLVAEDRDYADFVKWVESDPTGSRVATSCFDGFIRLYDLSGFAAQAASSPRPISPVSKIRPPGGQRPWGLSFSPEGNRLAVGFFYNPKVNVLEVKGNSLEHAYSPDTTGLVAGHEIDLRTVAWSSDGRSLYAAGGYRVKAVRQIRKWADGGRGSYSDLPTEVDLPINRMLPLRAGGILYASYDGSFGVLSDRGEITPLGPKAIPIYVAGFERFLLSPDGFGIQFVYERSGKSPAVFSVSERRLSEGASSPLAGVKAGFTFQTPITHGLGVSDWRTSLSPKLKGNPLPLVKNEASHSLAIKPDRSGFLLGTAWFLRHFDAAGKELWKVRTPGSAWGLNTNGQVAVAALSEGTIRWYRISDGKELLAFFPHLDRKRWILWTPSGYYDASPGGEDFIGWHLNNGREQAADFFPASRFRSTYYRPDIIDQVLKTLDEAEAIRLANENHTAKRPAAGSVREKLPPVVSILAPADQAEVSSPTITLRYRARSQEPITGVKILVDGRPVSAGSAGKDFGASGEISVPIPPRDCEVSVIAENRHAASEAVTVRLLWKGTAVGGEFQIRSKLYVLAVGVSEYQDSKLRLGLAAKDALDFGEVWKGQKGSLYSGVEARVLTDGQATKGNILDGLEWLQRQTTAKDVALLFFAGHGINDPNGLFYFLPVDAKLDSLKRTGLAQTDITTTVETIAGKVIVFIDACHSGDLMGKVKRRAPADISAVINELASAENGVVVFSSATGRQYALENSEWGNGAFTKGLVEGITGKADYSGTGRITVNMLDLYISERVKQLTGGEQTPATVKPPNVPDFPLAVQAKSN
jgi:WD40 repeat protein